MKKILGICTLIILAGCSSAQQEAIAHITQRRIDSSGKVMISYRFRANGGWVSDSMEVGRAVIVPHDSVRVVFTGSNPSESRLLLP